MSALADIITMCLLLAGAFFYLAGTLGLLRFPDPVSRLHALTKADNLGLGLITAGLLFQVSRPLTALKLLAVWVLVLIASAAIGQLIARSALDEEQPGT